MNFKDTAICVVTPAGETLLLLFLSLCPEEQ